MIKLIQCSIGEYNVDTLDKLRGIYSPTEGKSPIQ